MKNANYKIPVLLLVFNRKDAALQALGSIREYKPDRIYIAADGPRLNKPGEIEKCKETRDAVISMIDWQCEVKTLFRDVNLGCAEAVNSAIDWFFDNEEFGLIIEDDIILSQDFFKFCEEIGVRFKDKEDVMMISSQYLGKECEDYSYGFSPWAMIWGWATWARAWEKMDMSMSLWPQMKIRNLLKRFGLFKGLMLAKYWSNDYKTISSGGTISSWATRWAFNMAVHNGLNVAPYVNLSINVGCSGNEGAHYSSKDVDPYSNLKIGKMVFPLRHPKNVSLTREIVSIESKDFFRIRMIGLKKKIHNVFTNLFEH